MSLSTIVASGRVAKGMCIKAKAVFCSPCDAVSDKYVAQFPIVLPPVSPKIFFAPNPTDLQNTSGIKHIKQLSNNRIIRASEFNVIKLHNTAYYSAYLAA